MTTMQIDSAVVEQALEALLNSRPLATEDDFAIKVRKHSEAITALRVALAQEQAEPAQDQRCRAEPLSGGNFVCDCKIGECPGRSTAPPKAEPVQEPVAWRYKPMIGSSWSLSDDGYYISCKRDKGYIVEELHTVLSQRTMVPLTDEEILAAVGWERAAMYMKLTPNFPVDEAKKETLTNARAVEKASWEKNHGQA